MIPLHQRLSPEFQGIVDHALAGQSEDEIYDRDGVKPERVLEILCSHLRIPYLQLRPEMVDRRSFARRRQVCHEHHFLPLFENDIVMVAACVEPWNEGYLRDLRKALHMEIHLVGTCESNWDQAMAILDDPGSLAEWEQQQLAAAPPKPAEPAHVLSGWDLHNGDHQTVIRNIVRRAHALGASDIIMDPMENRLNVRFRIMGSIEVMPPISLSHRNALINATKIFAGIAVEEGKNFRSGRAQLTLGENYVLSLRVESQPTDFGDAIVMRLLDPMSIRRHAGTLPFRGEDLRVAQGCLEKSNGIILVTGPTGSGKTTTLYRCLTSLDLSALNVRTIEDPIEYQVDKIVQTQTSKDAGFAQALRSHLRADPDVILVGEIRDRETAEIAVQTALTGHLVLSTLHTNDAIGAIPRLLDLKVSPFLIGQTLSLVISQRLVPRLCPKCRLEMPMEDRVRRHFEHYKLPVPTRVYERGGCRHCKGTGLIGRIPIFEFFHVNEALGDLLQRESKASEIRAAWLAGGGVPLAKSGLGVVAAGDTPYHEVACYETVLF